jgi:short-subunit dehydrogenase
MLLHLRDTDVWVFAGLNVLLISRTQAKLDAAAEEVKKFKVQAKTLAIDFSKADASAWAKIKEAIEPLQVIQ